MSKQEDYYFILEMKLRKELKSAGMTIIQAAEKMGITREYFHKMIKPDKMTLTWLIDFCEKCDISVSKFLVLDDIVSIEAREPESPYGLQDKIRIMQKLLDEKDKTNLAQENLIIMLQTEIDRLKAGS